MNGDFFFDFFFYDVHPVLIACLQSEKDSGEGIADSPNSLPFAQ